MTKASLNQYKGSLSPEKFVEGINASTENARRLFEDAEILLNQSRYASATSLAILSIEESGKQSILREMSLWTDAKDLKAIWRKYRSHTEKNIAWILPDLAKKGANKMSDLREIFNSNSEHPQILDQLKQISFYTDCLGNRNWSIPNNVIDESLAKSLVKTAQILISKRKITVKEIELWQKHLAPIWKSVVESLKPQDIDNLQQAVECFEKEMHDSGIKIDIDEQLSDFIKNQKAEINPPNKSLNEDAH